MLENVTLYVAETDTVSNSPFDKIWEIRKYNNASISDDFDVLNLNEENLVEYHQSVKSKWITQRWCGCARVYWLLKYKGELTPTLTQLVNRFRIEAKEELKVNWDLIGCHDNPIT